MFVKLLYSALLAVVVLAAAGELLRIWTDTRLYIGAFDYASADGNAEEKGKSFATQVGLAHSLIFHQLQEYNQRGIGGTSDTTYNIGPDGQATQFRTNLDDMALTYQNVNIGQLLAGLRKSLSQPNEVSGSVTEFGGQAWASVSWPRAPRIGDRTETSFLTDTQADRAGVAHQVACGLAWAQVAVKDNGKDIRDMGRSRFCRWAAGLGVYSTLLASRQDASVPAITRWRSELKAMADAGVAFADVYRLRADFTDLLPTKDRQPLLPEAQDDRLQYALRTDPKIQALPAAERRLVAFGLARPALALKEGKLDGMGDNWRSVLDPYAEAISRAAAAVGSLQRDARGTAGSTAFRIRSDLIVTVAHVLGEAPTPTAAGGARDAAAPDPRIAGLYFCESDSAVAACPAKERFVVTDVVYDGAPDSMIAVLRIKDSQAPAVLRLRDTALAAEQLIDQYAYIIGYPDKDNNVPATLLNKLLGNAPGVKRLLPGRTLGFLPDPRPLPKAPVFSTDISTLAGTGGAPLVDLVSGRVIGLHFAGEWDPRKGKFSSSELITKETVAAIEAAIAPPKPAPAPPPPPAPPDAVGADGGAAAVAPTGAVTAPATPR